ncbi:MAG: hypothetical protein AAF700_12650 [Pseudomonadota bacterium]
MSFEFVEFGFDRAHHCGTVGVDEAVRGLPDGRLDLREFGLLRFAAVCLAGDFAVPNVFEHGGGYGPWAGAWSQGLEHRLKSVVHFGARDGFAA